MITVCSRNYNKQKPIDRVHTCTCRYNVANQIASLSTVRCWVNLQRQSSKSTNKTSQFSAKTHMQWPYINNDTLTKRYLQLGLWWWLFYCVNVNFFLSAPTQVCISLLSEQDGKGDIVEAAREFCWGIQTKKKVLKEMEPDLLNSMLKGNWQKIAYIANNETTSS